MSRVANSPRASSRLSRWSVAVAVLALPLAASAFDPFEAFVPGTTISAAEMNRRLDAIATAIDDLERRQDRVLSETEVDNFVSDNGFASDAPLRAAKLLGGVREVTADSAVGSNANGNAVARCDPSETLVGGGCRWTTCCLVEVYASYPDRASNSWRCSGRHAYGGMETLRAYALCATEFGQ